MEPMFIFCLIGMMMEIFPGAVNLNGVHNLDRGRAHPAFEHAATITWTNVIHMVYGDRFSFTPDVSGMSYEQRMSYLGSIAQGPGGHEERK